MVQALGKPKPVELDIDAQIRFFHEEMRKYIDLSDLKSYAEKQGFTWPNEEEMEAIEGEVMLDLLSNPDL